MQFGPVQPTRHLHVPGRRQPPCSRLHPCEQIAEHGEHEKLSIDLFVRRVIACLLAAYVRRHTTRVATTRDQRLGRKTRTTYAFDREVQSSLARSDIPADPGTFRARSLAKRRIACTLAPANPIDIYGGQEKKKRKKKEKASKSRAAASASCPLRSPTQLSTSRVNEKKRRNVEFPVK